jgi:hypothetical protein
MTASEQRLKNIEAFEAAQPELLKKYPPTFFAVFSLGEFVSCEPDMNAAFASCYKNEKGNELALIQRLTTMTKDELSG